MNNDTTLIFADHTGRFYAKQYGFPPVTGRLLGYLLVCEPMQQTINGLAEALFTSRSAINGSVKMLENYHLINRSRPMGSRVDLISIKTGGWERNGFDPEEYRQQARLGREGLELLKQASPERRAALEEIVSLADFLAERMPGLLAEWHTYHKQQTKPKAQQ